MKILLQKKWKTNMGEEILAKGAHATLQRAFPDAEILENSGWSRKLVTMKADGGLMNFLREKVGLSKVRKEYMRQNAADLTDHYDPDLIVIPGPSLHPEVYDQFRDLISGEIPVLLLGAGSPRYDEKTTQRALELIQDDPADAAIVRNELANSFAGPFDEFYEGIDNGFFIDDWFIPPTLDKKLIALTYDKTAEPTNVETNGKIIRPHHSPFGMLYPDFLRHFFATGWSEEWYCDEGWFASDTLKNYLTVYANVDVTYTDRLHACVPTLAYGNKAVFNLKTPRKGVLNHDFVKERNGVLSVDREKLKERKSDQVSLVRDVVQSIIKADRE